MTPSKRSLSPNEVVLRGILGSANFVRCLFSAGRTADLHQECMYPRACLKGLELSAPRQIVSEPVCALTGLSRVRDVALHDHQGIKVLVLAVVYC